MISRGDVFLAPLMFSNLAGAKRRPVCVLSDSAFNDTEEDAVVAMITTNRRRLVHPGIGDIPLTDWRGAGLLSPSLLRAGRLQSLEATLLSHKIGVLSKPDLSAVQSALTKVFGLKPS